MVNDPKSEPEGPQDLSDEEIVKDWRERFNSSGASRAMFDEADLRDYLKRHRAQPAVSRADAGLRHGLEQPAKYLRGGAHAALALDAIDHALALPADAAPLVDLRRAIMDWRESAHCMGNRKLCLSCVDSLARAVAPASRPRADAPLDALRRVQGQVVRTAHALTKALQGQGIDGADLRDTAIGIATGLMTVDAEITAALASAEGASAAPQTADGLPPNCIQRWWQAGYDASTGDAADGFAGQTRSTWCGPRGHSCYCPAGAAAAPLGAPDARPDEVLEMLKALRGELEYASGFSTDADFNGRLLPLVARANKLINDLSSPASGPSSDEQWREMVVHCTLMCPTEGPHEAGCYDKRAALLREERSMPGGK